MTRRLELRMKVSSLEMSEHTPKKQSSGRRVSELSNWIGRLHPFDLKICYQANQSA